MFQDHLRRPHRALAGAREQLRLELGRQHANDRPRGPIQADRPIHDPRIAAKPPLPQPVRNDCDRQASLEMLLWSKRPSERGSHAQGLPESVGDLGAEQYLGLPCSGVVVRIGNGGGDLFEGAAPLAPVEKVCRRDIIALTRRWALPERDDALRVGVRQRAEEQRVEQRGNRYGPAEPQREGHHGGGGERGGLSQHAQTMADVMDDFGVRRELLPQPGGIGECTKRAAYEIHVASPVEERAAIEGRVPVAEFSFPFVAPAAAPWTRNDRAERPHEPETQAKRERVAVC